MVILAIVGVYVAVGAGVYAYGMHSMSDDPSTQSLERLATRVAAVAWPLAIPIWLWLYLKQAKQ